MILRALRVRGWRNIAAAALEPGARATVLFGDNGQGKTNLIEAAYYLVTFRSFRTTVVEDVVGWGGEGAHLEAIVVAGGLERKLEVRLARGSKQTLLDGKAVRRDAEGLRGIGVVLFVPEDLLLPKAAPAERRRFLDRAIFGGDRTYFREALAFERVLKSRNAVLKQPAPRPALLDTYDEELARTGARIVARRRAVASALAPRLTQLFTAIHADLEAVIRYRSHPSVDDAGSEEEVRAALLGGLRERRDRDLRRRFTGFGPQTDDLEMNLSGRPAGEHGSQGQLRSLVLALKLAELAHLTEAHGEPPLLLLDDVASELDETRRRRLFETIASLSGQTLITVTDRGLLPVLPGRVDFAVKSGTLQTL